MHVLTAAGCRPGLCLWAVQARVGVPVVDDGGRCVRRAHLRQAVPGRNSGISPYTDTHTHTCAPSRVRLAICLPTCSLSQSPSNTFYTRCRTPPCAWCVASSITGCVPVSACRCDKTGDFQLHRSLPTARTGMMRPKALGVRVAHGLSRRQHSLCSCPACSRRALPSSSTVVIWCAEGRAGAPSV